VAVKEGEHMTDSEKLDLIIDKIASLDEKVEGLDQKVASLDGKVESLDKMVSNLELDVGDVKLTMENEVRVNIQRVAEGHLDLARNLHEAMKPSNEIEMLSIKVRTLESDMRELKRRSS
jgi:predicted RNase H-like nuclease (RuvC/YqgF family)